MRKIKATLIISCLSLGVAIVGILFVLYGIKNVRVKSDLLHEKNKNNIIKDNSIDNSIDNSLDNSLDNSSTAEEDGRVVAEDLLPKQDADKSNFDNKKLSNEGSNHESVEKEVYGQSGKNSVPSGLREKSLDSKKLKGLDNKKYSWWIRYKPEHQPPVISSTAKKLIDKYDGIFLGDTDKKVIYLTFDEGYENGYTPQILNTLKENNVKALFFITGSYMKKNEKLIVRMLDEGHIVGGHTIKHPSLPDINDAALESELHGFEKQFYSKFKQEIKYIRPPKGEFSERTLAASQQLGYKNVFWSLAYRDFETDKQKGADYAYKMVMDKLHNGAVILLHAVSKDNAEALDKIIKDIKAQGYEIRLMDM